MAPKLGPPAPFSVDRLKARAAALAARPYAAPTEPRVPATAPAYRPEAALWNAPQSDTAIRLFHLGGVGVRAVAVSVVENGQARAVEFADGLFEGAAEPPPGFAGFRAMNADGNGDWLAFLGASYFRAADPFNQFGLSARGVAIDTADGAEEFPDFTAFWLEKDPQGRLLVHALLDGPSLTGAFRILHRRGADGLVQEIEAELFFRKAVRRLGLAPLTSMYWYGQSDRTPADDWRPQVHDSDGLSIWTGAGERIWRPLTDPPRVTDNQFLDKSPHGFGLMQRDRRFEDYQDDEAFYEKRPSAWVEPVGDWGEGAVQLVEIPTAHETDDNIVAFWTPKAEVAAGGRLAYAYRLHWAAEEPGAFGVARVVATRQGRGRQPERRAFAVDFEGPALAGLDHASGVQPVVESRPGRIVDPVAYPISGTPRWRLAFDAQTAGSGAGGAIELRAYLRRGSAALTETWSFQALAA